MLPCVHIEFHPPDPANTEVFWMWWCECGEYSDEYALREDCEDSAEGHDHPAASDITFVTIDPDDYRLSWEQVLGEDETHD